MTLIQKTMAFVILMALAGVAQFGSSSVFAQAPSVGPGRCYGN